MSSLGLAETDAEELKLAIEADAKERGKKTGLGKRALEWVGRSALAIGKGGLAIGSDVAKVTLTAVAMKYAGIPPS